MKNKREIREELAKIDARIAQAKAQGRPTPYVLGGMKGALDSELSLDAK
jgi:hypothetical protein